jgi:hypothetical protein
MNYEEHFKESADKRTAFWENIGQLDPYVIAHAINPAFMGGPRWPSLRQAFITIDTPSGTILASDGLSDPYDDYDTNPKNQSYNGLGFEVYVQCSEKPEELGEIKKTWQFNLLYQVSQLAASNGNLISMLQEFKYISTEVYDVPVPVNFITKDERVGVLLGLESKTVPSELALSIETILIVNVTLLTVAEINYIIEKGEEARTEVAEKIQSQKDAGYSSLARKSVI